MKKEKLYSLDFIRFFCAIAIFIFHAHVDANFNVNFYELNYIFNQSVVFLTTFFILSGFVLRYNYSDKDLMDKNNCKEFIKKRIISIFPLYILTLLLYTLLDNDFNLYKSVIVMPVQFLMLHEYSHYDFMNNAGSWFFSCIFICYLLYPYINNILSKLSKKTKFVCFIVLLLLTLSIGLTSLAYGNRIYTNIELRFIEFLIGVFLADIIFENKKQLSKLEDNFLYKGFWFIAFLVYIGVIYLVEKYSPIVNLYQAPFTSLFGIWIIFAFATSKSRVLKKITENKFFKTLSDYSLEIWCSTFFCIKTMDMLPMNMILEGEHKNLKLGLMWLGLHIIYSIILKLFMKFAKNTYKKFGVKKVSYAVLIVFTILFAVKTII